MFGASVVIKLYRLRRFRQLAATGGGPFRKLYKQWGARYRGFVRTRFVRFSRGGGSWPKLKSKRRRGALGAAAILRDTGTLFAALQPVFIGSPGAIEQDIEFGIRVGYGGPHKHPSGAGVSIADIASFHQVGAGALPRREIIVAPDNTTIAAMKKDALRALDEAGNGD